MMVTYSATHTDDLTVSAVADHTLTEGQPVRCYHGRDGLIRVRRVVEGELPTGETTHGAGPGMPVTVLVRERAG